MTIEEYFGRWMRVIDKKELILIMNELKKINPTVLCPSMRNVFRAFELCKYDDCRVVFLGQDPYPQKGVATGILFGNRKETPDDKLSPSLEVIKECAIDYTVPHAPIDFDITLESWAKQGILMINSALTCKINEVGSHVNMWRPFVSKLLKNLSEKESGIIYVLFGRQAQTFKPYIRKDYNFIIEIEHPAYFARTKTIMPHRVFTDIDKILKDYYNTKIVWYNEFN